MHKFRPDLSAIRRFQRIDDIPKRGFISANVERPSLESGIDVSLGQAVKKQFQIRHIHPLHQAERIKFCLLMSPLSVGSNKLKHLDLLALVLNINAPGSRGRQGTCPLPAKQFKVRLDSVMGGIRPGVTIGSRQSVKKATPLFWYAIGVVEIGFVQTFNVGRITAG